VKDRCADGEVIGVSADKKMSQEMIVCFYCSEQIISVGVINRAMDASVVL